MIYQHEQQYEEGGFTGDWMFQPPFEDTDQIADWVFEGVAWYSMNKVIHGKDNNLFDPNGLVSRVEMAAILTQYLEQGRDFSQAFA